MKLLACALVLIALVLGCASRQPQTAAYPYEHPLASPGAQLGGLPPAVQNTIRAQVGGADIYQITKANRADETVYEITFQQPDRYPPLYVAADGSVLYPDLRVAVGAPVDTFGAVSGGASGGVKFSDLPVNVAKTIQQKAPTAEVAFINKVTINNKIFYEVRFKDERQPQMFIAEDGTLLSQKPE